MKRFIVEKHNNQDMKVHNSLVWDQVCINQYLKHQAWDMTWKKTLQSWEIIEFGR